MRTNKLNKLLSLYRHVMLHGTQNQDLWQTNL